MIRILGDHESLSRSATELIVEAARADVDRAGRFTIALAGGSTPRRTYEMLALHPARDRMPWRDVHVFWSDERCVSPDDRRSNAGEARRLLLDQVPIPGDQVHPIQCAGDAGQAASRYASVIGRFFEPDAPRLDLVLLGLGVDGHTASLLPESAAAREKTCWTSTARDASHDLPRVTLTAPLLNQARRVVFLVSGPAKSTALAAALDHLSPPETQPSRLIRPVRGELIWLVDRAAAALLPHHLRERSIAALP